MERKRVRTCIMLNMCTNTDTQCHEEQKKSLISSYFGLQHIPSLLLFPRQYP